MDKKINNNVMSEKRDFSDIISGGDRWTGPLSTAVSDDRESPREDGVGRWCTWTACCWPHPSWNPPPPPPLPDKDSTCTCLSSRHFFFHFSHLSLSYKKGSLFSVFLAYVLDGLRLNVILMQLQRVIENLNWKKKKTKKAIFNLKTIK